MRFIIGTSGYSFADWVGAFYPAGTQSRDMFAYYVQHFAAAELNYTYYRMPSARTLEALARKSPAGFRFWVKGNHEITHKHNPAVIGDFTAALSPLIEADRFAGVLLQFPQSFHREQDNRRYLASVIDAFADVPLAVEFRHASWQGPTVNDGLAGRGVTLVVPDSPAIPSLYHAPPTATSRTGYLRLHSRDAGKWYAGGAQRYDYNYSERDLAEVAAGWSQLGESVDRVYTFFNNCHGGQAAANAEAFQRIVETL